MDSLYRHYPVSGRILPGPLIFSLLGTLFCAWSAWGNGLNLCITAGCSLYQDFKVGGVSLWWAGVAGFGVLVLIAIVGRPRLGHALSAVGMFIDVALLFLMMLTAPCAACLIAAVFLALAYASFRAHAVGKAPYAGRSALLWIWALLFVINVGGIVRAEVGQFAIHGPEDSSVRIYFSPSCPSCREGVTALSGRINAGFYPVAEDDSDTVAVAAMIKALEGGASMAEAIKAVQPPPEKNPLGWIDSMVLRFKMLCNKAHVLGAGSQVVPFVEYHGLPASLGAQARSANGPPKAAAPRPVLPQAPKSNDFSLPVDTGLIGGCGKNQTCP